jgi:hypothetical protein
MRNKKKITTTEGINLYMREDLINYLNRFIVPWIPMGIGLGIFFLSNTLLPMRITFSLGLFVGGITGVIVIIRQEIAAGLFVITGKRAIVEGLIFTLICWGVHSMFSSLGFKILNT